MNTVPFATNLLQRRRFGPFPTRPYPRTEEIETAIIDRQRREG